MASKLKLSRGEEAHLFYCVALGDFVNHMMRKVGNKKKTTVDAMFFLLSRRSPGLECTEKVAVFKKSDIMTQQNISVVCKVQER